MRSMRTLFLLVAIAFGGVAAATAQDSGSVSVRVRDADNFSRIIFSFATAVPYQIDPSDSRLRIVFTGTQQLDISELDGRVLAGLRAASIAVDGNTTVFDAEIPPGTTVRHLRSGTALVVDITPPRGTDLAAIGFDPAGAEAGAEEGTASASTGAPRGTDASPSATDTATSTTGGDTAQQGADTATQTVVQISDPAADSADTGGTGTGAASPPPDTDSGTVISAEDIERARFADGALDLNIDLPDDELPGDLGTLGPAGSSQDIEGQYGRQFNLQVNPGTRKTASEVILDIQEIQGGQQLRFNWPERVAAAAFERAGSLWLVFDRAYSLNLDRLIENEDVASRRISEFTVEDHPDALVVRIGVRENQNYMVTSEGRNWMVAMKDSRTTPRFPLSPTRRVDPQKGQQIFIPARNIGREIEIEDPIVGDLLVVLPLQDEGRGISADYSSAVAEIPMTAQGILVVPLTDFVQVDRYRDGVAISAEGSALFQGATADLNFFDGSAGEGLIDFNGWRQGPKHEYRKYEARVLFALSASDSDQELEEARFRLAKFYLGHGRAAEALGIMELMIEDNEALERDPQFRAVRGVANLKMHRYSEAEDDLALKELSNEQDLDLWRVLLSEKKDDYTAAVGNFRRGRDLLGSLDVRDRTAIQLAVIRSAVELDDNETIERELRLLSGVDLTDYQAAEAEYLNALYYQNKGQSEDAQIIFERLSDARDRRISALARYRSTLESLAQEEIDKSEAAERLERLRYVWRGDNQEAQIMDILGQFYYDLGEYSEALEVMRDAVAIYPVQARSRRLLSRMTTIFRELFLDGRADELSPIGAISLWLRFRDLTPLGSEGDLMIRRLADRLVEVELLDRAAELLEYQVQERLEGAARAQVASNLAAIYTRNTQAERALAILRATREPQLPRDILTSRRWVEARALIDLSRFEEAEVLLENDLSANAERLRSQLYWQSRAWGKLADTNRRLLGDSADRGDPLNDEQRVHLMRLTLALTFLDDRQGLIGLRSNYGPLMASGDFANGFELLTSDQELTGQELSDIASQIASVQKLSDFLQEYRADFDSR